MQGFHEGEGDSGLSHSPRAANAVDVVVAEFRDVEIDDVRDAGDVDSTPDDIGGDEAANFSVAKVLHHAVATRLGQIAVDGSEAVDGTGFEKFPVQPFGTEFRAAKHDRLLGLFSFEKVEEDIEFNFVWDEQVKLVDRIGGDFVERKVHHLGGIHVAFGKLQDRRREGSAEEKGLTGLGAAFEDVLDVITKADVKHPVGFVEDCKFDFVQGEVAAFDVIDDSAWSSDDNGRSFFKLVGLALHRFAAVEADDRELTFAGKFLDFLANLNRQFAGGGQDDRRRFVGFEFDKFQNRQGERGSFSRPGLGLAEEIMLLEGQRNQGRLDWRRPVVADLGERCQGLFRKSKLLKIESLFSFRN